MKKISNVLESDIEKIHKDEVCKIIFELNEWLHYNVKTPCIDKVNCETLLILVMRLFYSNLMQKFMTDFQKSSYLKIKVGGILDKIRSSC